MTANGSKSATISLSPLLPHFFSAPIDVLSSAIALVLALTYSRILMML
jgi:hypothetical protein